MTVIEALDLTRRRIRGGGREGGGAGFECVRRKDRIGIMVVEWNGISCGGIVVRISSWEESVVGEEQVEKTSGRAGLKSTEVESE